MASVRYAPHLFGDTVTSDPKLAWLGRPVVSHVLAELVASGRLRKRHRVLDVGCGRGTDLVALAAWGFGKLDGLDSNRAELREAKKAERRALGKSVVRWKAGTLAALADYRAASFDLVLDVFLLSNFERDQDARYFREIARVLKPGGLLVLHFKVEPGPLDPRALPRPPRGLYARERRFRTAVAEGDGGLDEPQLVMVDVLERRDLRRSG